MLVTWFLVWVCRRENTGFQYTVPFMFVGGYFFFHLFFTDLKFFRVVLLVHEVSGSLFLF